VGDGLAAGRVEGVEPELAAELPLRAARSGSDAAVVWVVVDGAAGVVVVEQPASAAASPPNSRVRRGNGM
jgi:hypothetical protein